MISKYSSRRALVPIGPSIAYIPLSRGLYALIARYETIHTDRYVWYAEPCGDTWRVRNNQVGRLHSFLMGTKGRMITVDHVVPGNGLNNLPHNLRLANASQQMANQRIRRANVSGAKGVGLYGKHGHWRARIKIRGKLQHLGVYPTFDAAVAARKKAFEEAFGEFARHA